MSRREDRTTEARRHRPRSDREPSPKRSRRDDKLEHERPPAETKSDKDRGADQKHHRRLRDPLALESPLVHDSKVETRTVSKDTDDKVHGPLEGTKRSSDPTKVSQSRTYFQHDDRSSAGQNGRNIARRTDKEHGWRKDPNEQKNERTEDKTAASNIKDEKAKDGRAENRTWGHDGYFQMEANSKPATSRRPAFREQKAPTELEKKPYTTAANPNSQKLQDRDVEGGRRDRDERRFNAERPERPERSIAWSNSRDRYGGGSRDRYGGRERFNAREGYHVPAGGYRVEKWKHDLYDEANKSPNLKTEEDQISKIEALLAS